MEATMISASRVAALLLAAVSSAPAIGPDAVWKPPEDFRARVDKKCGKAADFRTCFVSQMRAAGADEAALAFAKRTDNQGYATSFRDTGIVDIATAEYPYRANENLLVFLVNGEPPMIDVDDLSRLEQKTLDANAAYASLRAKYPAITPFPSDRRPGLVGSTKLRSGGQRFVVVYLLKDGCHACAVVGDAYVAFEFDVEGKFVGTDVVRVRPRSHF
jgi:hypothetical protein